MKRHEPWGRGRPWSSWHGSRRATWCALLGAWALCSAWTSPAHAHQVGLSRGLYTAAGDTVEVEIVLARPEAMTLIPGLDANGDRTIDAREVDASADAFARRLVDGIAVHTREPACTGTFVGAALTEEDGLAVRGRYTCSRPGRVTVDVLLVKELAAGHRHLAHAVTAEGESDHMATAAVPSFTFGADAAPPSRLAFIGIGVEHILLGFDHLVFLFALILVGGSLRSLLAVVTAFTVAHSLTLGLAVLGVVAPPPWLVEPLIALSIAYVGVENLFVTSAAGRWRVTAPFGLVHGFGFAGALQEIGVPRDDVPMTLLLFNVGVEVGQLLVMAVVVPLLLVLRSRAVLDARQVRAVSVGIVVLGLFWCVERVMGAFGDASSP